MDVNWIVHYRVTDAEAAVFALEHRQTTGEGGAKWDRVGPCRSRDRVPHRDDPPRGRRTARERGRRSRRRSSAEATSRWAAGGVGLQVAEVCFGDIHPPLEVVPAFREVSSALEEKEAAINEAEASSANRGRRPRSGGRADGGGRRIRRGEDAARRPLPARFLAVAAARGGALRHADAALPANGGNGAGRPPQSDLDAVPRGGRRVVPWPQRNRLAANCRRPSSSARSQELKGTKEMWLASVNTDPTGIKNRSRWVDPKTRVRNQDTMKKSLFIIALLPSPRLPGVACCSWTKPST